MVLQDSCFPDHTQMVLFDPAVKTSDYKIYVKVIGKPGGGRSMKTGLCETTDGSVCIVDPLGTWSLQRVLNWLLTAQAPTNKVRNSRMLLTN